MRKVFSAGIYMSFTTLPLSGHSNSTTHKASSLQLNKDHLISSISLLSVFDYSLALNTCQYLLIMAPCHVHDKPGWALKLTQSKPELS
jgi:hypothetical protein